jgi:hypothetical protein
VRVSDDIEKKFLVGMVTDCNISASCSATLLHHTSMAALAP